MHLGGLVMGLTKYKLGELIEQSGERNYDNKYTADDIRGISTEKAFIGTKANMDGVSVTSYKVVKEDEFAYVADTSRRGDKIAVAYNNDCKEILISSIYTVFFVKRKDLLLSDYLFMFFNRPEFDRYSRFNSWGSARETFGWEDMCDIDIELPSLQIQQKYVDVYYAMLTNQQSYERGLDDLRIVCEGYLDNLRVKLPYKRIGDYIELSENKNESNEYNLDNVRGVSIEKRFIETKADMKNVELRPYYIVKPNEFAYVTVTSRNGGKISIAFNDTMETYICSSSYIVFRCRDENKLLPRYLRIYFERSEFNRYARFHSWGSARETFDYTEMKEVCIPIPDISVQRAIADIFESYTNRRAINEKLKSQIKDICSILIKGSIEEARKRGDVING